MASSAEPEDSDVAPTELDSTDDEHPEQQQEQQQQQQQHQSEQQQLPNDQPQDGEIDFGMVDPAAEEDQYGFLARHREYANPTRGRSRSPPPVILPLAEPDPEIGTVAVPQPRISESALLQRELDMECLMYRVQRGMIRADVPPMVRPTSDELYHHACSVIERIARAGRWAPELSNFLSDHDLGWALSNRIMVVVSWVSGVVD